MKLSGVAIPELHLRITYFGSRTMDRDVERSQAGPEWVVHWNTTRTATAGFGGRTWRLGPERLVVIPPSTAVRETMARGEEHTYVHFSLGPFGDRVSRRLFVLPARGAIRRLLGQVSSAYRAKERLARADFHRVQALVGLVLAELPEDAWRPVPADPLLREVVRFIETHHGEGLRNSGLARVAGMSTNGFVRWFSRHMGRPPHKHLSRVRADHAARLLLHTDVSIKEIARRCGFCDRHYFTAVFARLYGSGPAAYRRAGEVERAKRPEARGS